MKKRKKNKTIRETYYLFVDLEATGLNFDGSNVRENNILEIAYQLRDKEIRLIDKGTYVVNLKNINIKNMDPKAKELHTKNNLLNNCQKSKLNIKEIDNIVYERIKFLILQNSNILLAGNNVGYDYELLRREMPKTFSLLHHRLLDVSVIREFINIKNTKYTNKITNKKKYLPRAEQDIEESVNELKEYLQSITLK